MAKDPACAMTVDEKQAAGTATQDGKTYYFCSAGCKDKFRRHAVGAINSSGDRKERSMSHDSNVERSRITLLTGGLALALCLTSGRRAHASSPPLPGVTVYKSPT